MLSCRVHPTVPQHPLPCPLRQPKPLRHPRRENARSPTRAFTPRPAKPATRPAQGAPIPSRPRAPVASRHLCAPPQRPCSQGGRAWSASSAGGAAPLSRPRSPPSYPRPHRSLPPPPLRLKVKPRRPEPRENAPVIDTSRFFIQADDGGGSGEAAGAEAGPSSGGSGGVGAGAEWVSCPVCGESIRGSDYCVNTHLGTCTNPTLVLNTCNVECSLAFTGWRECRYLF